MYAINRRDSISRHIAPIPSMEVGDDATRPRRQDNIKKVVIVI
jgi:hypothetical protein